MHSLTGRLGELVEAMAERRMDVLCVQETRWRSECRLFGAIGKRYKLFLMGNEAKTDGEGIFVAECHGVSLGGFGNIIISTFV